MNPQTTFAQAKRQLARLLRERPLLKMKAARATSATERGREERDYIIAALSRCYEAHLMPSTRLARPGWELAVCVHLPAGMVSWEIHEDHVAMFKHLSTVDNHYDGCKRNERLSRLMKETA
jgi:hypothetical protein